MNSRLFFIFLIHRNIETFLISRNCFVSAAASNVFTFQSITFETVSIDISVVLSK